MSNLSQQDGVKYFPTSEGMLVAGENDQLGRGTYGTVWRARLQSNPSVERAVKLFIPETIDENEGVPSTTLREINAVRSISHPNIMSVKEIVVPESGKLTEMYLVMELCLGTLRDKLNDMIKVILNEDVSYLKPTEWVKLPAEYVRECKIIAWQLLNAVAVCHSHGIMHRDIKPANILYSSDHLVKIADFGLARFVRGRSFCEDMIVPQTGEVQTMWYRAPEVILGDDKYGLLVDDWSIGCVIAEMFRFRMSNSNKRMEPDPLFPGRGDVHMYMLILESLGTPTDSYVTSLPYYSTWFPKWKTGNLRQKLMLLDDVGFDLISSLLTISPTERKASRFVLNHPWFDELKPRLTRFIPWYRGNEQDLLRLLKVERLPKAKPLALVTNSKNNKENYVRN